MDDDRLRAVLQDATTDPAPEVLARTSQLLVLELARQAASRDPEVPNVTGYTRETISDEVAAVVLRVTDLDHTERFFAELFGAVSERTPSRLVRFTNLGRPVVLIDDQHAPPMILAVRVDDPAAAAEQALTLGGRLEREETPGPDGITHVGVDNQGLGVAFAPRSGPSASSNSATADAALEFVFLFGDVERARAFYGDLLGWTFTKNFPRSNHHEVIGGVAFADESEPSALPVFGVGDGGAARARVVELGGTVDEEMGYGPAAVGCHCTDGNGTSFVLRYPGDVDAL
jgi:predicted enzyme related to lactoylglutathione lyase